MSKKKLTTMRIDEALLKKARELGLNVSKVSENALKDMISRIETPTPHSALKDPPDDH